MCGLKEDDVWVEMVGYLFGALVFASLYYINPSPASSSNYSINHSFSQFLLVLNHSNKKPDYNNKLLRQQSSCISPRFSSPLQRHYRLSWLILSPQRIQLPHALASNGPLAASRPSTPHLVPSSLALLPYSTPVISPFASMTQTPTLRHHVADS